MTRPFEILCDVCGVWSDGNADGCLGCGAPRGENVTARGGNLDVIAEMLRVYPDGVAIPFSSGFQGIGEG